MHSAEEFASIEAWLTLRGSFTFCGFTLEVVRSLEGRVHVHLQNGALGAALPSSRRRFFRVLGIEDPEPNSLYPWLLAREHWLLFFPRLRELEDESRAGK